MDVFFSPSQNAFLNPSWIELYKNAGSWPADALAVPQQIFSEFGATSAPEGKVRGVGENGLPIWVDAPLPTESEKALAVRQMRDALLRETDWTQAQDVPMETRERWMPYRQALRDLTAQKGFPFDVQYPERPSSI